MGNNPPKPIPEERPSSPPLSPQSPKKQPDGITIVREYLKKKNIEYLESSENPVFTFMKRGDSGTFECKVWCHPNRC